MSKANVWMPLYVSDWDDKTRHLTCEQDGAYGRLVRRYWKSGPPPDDDGQLAQLVGMSRARWLKVRPFVAPFFHIRDGVWLHERVEEELERARELVEKRRQAGLQGGRPRKQDQSTSKANGSANEKLTGKQSETPARVVVDVPVNSVQNPNAAGPSKEDADSQGKALGQVIPLDGRAGR